MAKKITLADIAKILKKDKTKGDTSYWGVVQSVNKTNGKVTSYDVSLGGSTGTVKCRKLAGAEVGNTVLVTLRSTGEAVVVGTKNGDKDALDAPVTFTTSTVVPPYKKGDMWIYSDFKKVCVTTKTASQSYSASDWEDIGGTGEQNNYFWYDSEGAHVSLLEKSTTNVNNVLINSNGMEVRNGSTTLSKFASSLIELGKNNTDAQIEMCGGRVKIYKNASGIFHIENANTSETKKAFVSFSCVDSDAESRVNIHAKYSNTSPQAGVIIVDEADRSYVSIYGDDVSIKGSTLADFVTEQGTTSSWNYRKWRSGKKECWRTVTQSITKAGGSGPYYGDGSTVSFPSSFFSSAPMVQMSNSGSADGWLGTTSAATLSATGQPRLYRLADWTGSKSVTLSIYAIGS